MIELVGGPLDGESRRRRRSGFVFATPAGRLYDKPGPDRHLYREAGQMEGGGTRFVHAPEYGVCLGCRAVQKREHELESCSLCGGDLASG